MSLYDEPDYYATEFARTGDAKANALALADIAYELRTANLIAFHADIRGDRLDDSSLELHKTIIYRLRLK